MGKYPLFFNSQRNSKRRCSRAFTLVEILLVMSLLSVISIALFNSFSNGLKIWERGYRSLTEEDVFIFLDKLKQDLQNTVHYSKIPFEGKPDSVSFAAIIMTPMDANLNPEGDKYTHQIGRVEYHWDQLKGNLYRRQANYSQALNDKQGPGHLLVSALKSVSFLYFYWDEKMTSTAKGLIPTAVLVRVVFGSGSNQREMNRMINIPAGN